MLGRGAFIYGGRRKSNTSTWSFCKDNEVEKVTKFLSHQSIPDYDETITEEPEILSPNDLTNFNTNKNSRDELYDEALALVVRERRASTSFIQRHLKIGYNRSATIIEKM